MTVVYNSYPIIYHIQMSHLQVLSYI